MREFKILLKVIEIPTVPLKFCNSIRLIMKTINEHVIEFKYSNKTQHEVDSPQQRQVSLLVLNTDAIPLNICFGFFV